METEKREKHSDITSFLIRSNNHYTKGKRTSYWHPKRLQTLYQNLESDKLVVHDLDHNVPGSACHFAKELPLEEGDDPEHPKYLISCRGMHVFCPSTNLSGQVFQEEPERSPTLNLQPAEA